MDKREILDCLGYLDNLSREKKDYLVFLENREGQVYLVLLVIEVIMGYQVYQDLKE